MDEKRTISGSAQRRCPEVPFWEVADCLGFLPQSCCVNRPTAVVEMWPADPKDLHRSCLYLNTDIKAANQKLAGPFSEGSHIV